ncbi:MAG: sigma-70 family RNA polymerase sigma factor [Anaerolineales bacterium]|nr:sigma-70 family RNA polymerase sigma factor [Anaerolineales bacterium]
MTVSMKKQDCNAQKSVAVMDKDDDLDIDTGVEDFAEIYVRHFRQVFSYVFYRLQDPQIADDITVKTFEEALKNIDRYQPDRASLPTWLIAIARNSVNKYLRSEKIRRWFSLEVVTSNLQDTNPTVEEIVIGNERIARLMLLVKEMNERQRDVLGLKFGAGLSNQQIAQTTGLSVSNVGVILYRSLNNLRKRWQEVDNEEA